MSGYAGYGQYGAAAQQAYQNTQQYAQGAQQVYHGAQQLNNQMGQFPALAGQQPFQQAQQYAQPVMQGIQQAQYAGNQVQNTGNQAQYAAQQFAGGHYAAGTAAAMGATAGAMSAATQPAYNQMGQPAYNQMQMAQLSPQNPQFAPKPMQIAPMNNMQRPTGPQQWSSSIWACCDDCYICCQSTPVQYGENYRKLYGDGFCSCCLLYFCCSTFACFFANGTRATLRGKYNLPEEPCGDCCVHWCCGPCAVCQEARELRRREGWQTWTS